MENETLIKLAFLVFAISAFTIGFEIGRFFPRKRKEDDEEDDDHFFKVGGTD